MDMATNVHELRGRSAKVSRIIGHLDALARQAGVNPHSAHGIHVIREMLDRWSELHWRQAALTVGGSVPSVQTRRLVADIYRRRSEGAK